MAEPQTIEKKNQRKPNPKANITKTRKLRRNNNKNNMKRRDKRQTKGPVLHS